MGGVFYWIGSFLAISLVGILIFLANVWPGGYNKDSAASDMYGTTQEGRSKKKEH